MPVSRYFSDEQRQRTRERCLSLLDEADDVVSVCFRLSRVVLLTP